MKKTLLAGASLAVMFTAANALAAEYTGDVTTEAGQSFYIEAGSTLKDANFSVEAQGTEQTANRVSFGSYDKDTTITVLGNNTIKDFATVELGQNDAKTTFTGAGNLTVEGYMTSTRNANADFSDVNLTFKKGEGGSVVGENSALVLDNDTTAFKVGNTTFTDGSRISLYKAAAGENGEEASGDASNLAIAAGKTVTFEGNNKIAPSSGEYAKSQFNITGEEGSNINVNGNVDVAIDTSIDGANVNINTDSETDPARLTLQDGKELNISNSNVSMDGAPDGKLNGIVGTGNSNGTVNLTNAKVDITNGAGIAVDKVVIGEGSVVNASGQMEISNPDNPKWQSGSIIQGLTSVDIAEGATVNIADGAQIVTGYPDGEINVAGTVNMSGENALIRASSKQDGSETSTLNVSGIVNVLKDALGIIASRETNVEEGGAVVVASDATLKLIQDMNRGAAADQEPTGDNAKFNVAGSLVNNGTINAEKTDITINGAALAEAGEDGAYAGQTAGGVYVSNNGTLNGNLTLTGVNSPASEDSAEKIAAMLKAAPRAEFSGNNTVNGNIENTLGIITVNQGAVVNMGEGNSVTNNGYIDLAGSLNGEITNNGSITVLDSSAHMTKFTGGELNISANTSASSLVSEESTADEIYVNAGSALNLDSKNLKTSQLTTYGTTKLGVDYAANAKVGKGGTLDLASKTLTGDVALWDNSTLAFNVDNIEEAKGGKVEGSIKTNLTSEGSATINPVIGIDAGEGTYTFANGVSAEAGTAEFGENSLKLSQNNALYNVSFGEDKNTLNVSKKDSGEVASSVVSAGGTASDANTINAWVGGNADTSSLSGTSRTVAEHLHTLAQTDQASMVNAAKALAPETAAMVQSNVTETAHQVFSAVGTRLSGGSMSTGGEGMSSGDSIFKRGAMWIQGLFNHAEADDTNRAKGFDADSEGIAFGAEKYINDDTKLGIGYAYTTSDIDGFMRTTDVDTHTAIAYGEYKPSDWYVNAIATYGWSDYSEDKNVAGLPVKADYDVNSIGLQAMTGYDLDLCGTTLTPEAGLRYVNIRQDSYTDTAGQRVSENTSDILTGVIGAKVKKNFALENGMNLRPEARLAMTYDMFNDANNSVVTLANGAAYTVNGEALDRLGFEAGVGLTADVNDNVELSLGYEGRFRDNYEDHTGLINAKYKF